MSCRVVLAVFVALSCTAHGRSWPPNLPEPSPPPPVPRAPLSPLQPLSPAEDAYPPLLPPPPPSPSPPGAQGSDSSPSSSGSTEVSPPQPSSPPPLPRAPSLPASTDVSPSSGANEGDENDENDGNEETDPWTNPVGTGISPAPGKSGGRPKNDEGMGAMLPIILLGMCGCFMYHNYQNARGRAERSMRAAPSDRESEGINLVSMTNSARAFVSNRAADVMDRRRDQRLNTDFNSRNTDPDEDGML